MKNKRLIFAGLSGLFLTLSMVLLLKRVNIKEKKLMAMQCAANTAEGDRCQREPLDSSDFCWQHDRILEEA